MTEPDQDLHSRRTITFAGNTYDLAALVAVITGATLLFTCLTCGVGGYCLPLVPIIAGIAGLTAAARAADPERTRLFSWLGIGAGSAYLLLALALIVVYVAALLIAAAVH